MKVKLAEALLRRKELNEKVEQLKKINTPGLFETKMIRKAINENIDDIVITTPKISLNQVTAAFDHYAKQLRLIDAVIQQANWVTEIDVDKDAMKDFVDPFLETTANIKSTGK